MPWVSLSPKPWSISGLTHSSAPSHSCLPTYSVASQVLRAAFDQGCSRRDKASGMAGRIVVAKVVWLCRLQPSLSGEFGAPKTLHFDASLSSLQFTPQRTSCVDKSDWKRWPPAGNVRLVFPYCE